MPTFPYPYLYSLLIPIGPHSCRVIHAYPSNLPTNPFSSFTHHYFFSLYSTILSLPLQCRAVHPQPAAPSEPMITNPRMDLTSSESNFLSASASMQSQLQLLLAKSEEIEPLARWRVRSSWWRCCWTPTGCMDWFVGDIQHLRAGIRNFKCKLYKATNQNGGATYIHCTAGLRKAPVATLAYMF